MRLHFPDTSALSDLAEPHAVLVRHRLIDEVGAGRIVILGTAPLLLELNGTRAVDAVKHRAMVDLFYRISVGSTLLLDPTTRRERELQLGRGLEYPEFVESRFEPPIDANAVDMAAAFAAGAIAGMRVAEAEKAENAIWDLDERERRAMLARGEVFDSRDPAWRHTLKQETRNDSYVFQLAEDTRVPRSPKSGGESEKLVWPA